MKHSRFYFLLCSIFIVDPSAAQEMPQHLKCIQAGSWACGTGADAICIDVPHGRGRRYEFEWAKMTFHGPEGRGRILSREGKNTFKLSDGTTAIYRGRQIVTGESVVDIRISPNTIYGLWCLQGRWPLKPFSPEWFQKREQIKD